MDDQKHTSEDVRHSKRAGIGVLIAVIIAVCFFGGESGGSLLAGVVLGVMLGAVVGTAADFKGYAVSGLKALTEMLATPEKEKDEDLRS